MSAQLGLVCECVQKGLLLFFFVCVEEKKPNNQFQTVVVAKERKSRERERKRGEVKQREEKVSRVSHNSLPSVCVSAVVLKSNKAL